MVISLLSSLEGTGYCNVNNYAHFFQEVYLKVLSVSSLVTF